MVKTGHIDSPAGQTSNISEGPLNTNLHHKYITQGFTSSQPPILESCPFAGVLLHCVFEHSNTLHMINRLIPTPHPPLTSPPNLNRQNSRFSSPQYEVLRFLRPFDSAYIHPMSRRFRTEIYFSTTFSVHQCRTIDWVAHEQNWRLPPLACRQKRKSTTKRWISTCWVEKTRRVWVWCIFLVWYCLS